MKNFFNRHPGLLTAMLFLFVVLTSFCVRTWHYNNAVEQLRPMIRDTAPASDEKHGPLRKLFPLYHNNFSPFTIESAMMFAYARDIAEGRGVPSSDPRLAGMEDLPPYAQMNMGLEWFLGWGWRYLGRFLPWPAPTVDERCFQETPAMAQWMSTQLRLWASLTSGFLFLWLLAMRCPRTLACAGGLLHAVALAAVARSTGQDIVRGEFCIPLFTACLALAWSLYAKPKLWKYAALFLCSFLAFVTWDLCQMLFGIWVLCELLHFLLGYRFTKSRMTVWGVIAAAILLNAAFVPFNRAYSLWRAPILWSALPALGCVFLCQELRGLRFFRRRAARLIPALVLPFMLYGIWSVTVNTPEYASNYSHFSKTMKSKLKFRNVKPYDPEKLDYDSRILWTPSMHSATWDIAVSFFPSFQFGRLLKTPLLRFLFGHLPLTLAFFYLLLVCTLLFSIPRREILNSARISLMPVVLTVGFTAGFIYIVRYHEFLILFLAAALPLLMRDYLRAFRVSPAKININEAYTKLYSNKRFMKTIRGLLLAAAAFLLFWESVSSLGSERKYTGDVPMAATAQLIAWFHDAGDAVKGKIVAANLTTGPMLMAYAGTGITMNPQFGLKRIRDATEEFIRAMFTGDENILLDYCEKYHADYVLYNKGTVFDMTPCSLRYIAAAKKIDPKSPANLMYYHPGHLRWFCRIPAPNNLGELNATFNLFKVIRPEDRKKAALLAFEAQDEKYRGAAERAGNCVRQALNLDPANSMAREIYAELYGKYPEIQLEGLP